MGLLRKTGTRTYVPRTPAVDPAGAYTECSGGAFDVVIGGVETDAPYQPPPPPPGDSGSSRGCRTIPGGMYCVFTPDDSSQDGGSAAAGRQRGTTVCYVVGDREVCD